MSQPDHPSRRRADNPSTKVSLGYSPHIASASGASILQQLVLPSRSFVLAALWALHLDCTPRRVLLRAHQGDGDLPELGKHPVSYLTGGPRYR